MKAIPFEQESVDISDLTDSHIIGVQFESGNRSFIKKIDENRYIFVNLMDKNANYTSLIVQKSISDALGAMTYCIRDVYLFGSTTDLVKWLINDR